MGPLSRAQAQDLHTRRGSQRSALSKLVAENEGTRSNKTTQQASARARWVLTDTNRQSNDQANKEEAEASGAFDAIVEQAGKDDRYDNKLRWAGYKDDGELTVRYFNAYRSSAKNRMDKQFRRWQIHKERHSYPGFDDWRPVLELLDSATQAGADKYERRMETVRLSDGVRASFHGNTGESILEIMQRTGSHVQMLPSDGKVGFNALSLWGTSAQNAHATKMLPDFMHAVTPSSCDWNANLKEYQLRLEVVDAYGAVTNPLEQGDRIFDKTDSQYCQEQDVIDQPDIEQLKDAIGDLTYAPPRTPIPIRAVWRQSSTTPEMRLRNRPQNWTPLIFSAYVDDLTQSAPRLARRKLYGSQSPKSTQAHVETVTDELISIFMDSKVTSFITNEALDRCLRFFIRYNNLAAIRRVFLRLEDHSYSFTASNFDTLLSAAAKETSVHNFQYTLRLMLLKGLRTTPETWSSMHRLMCRKFPLEANIVVEAMRRKGLLANVDAVQDVAANGADIDLLAHLAVGGTLGLFLNKYQSQFGERSLWLVTSVANKMARVLFEKGRVRDAVEVVGEMDAYARIKGRPGVRTGTVNTFLASALRDRDPEAAVAYLKVLLRPDEMQLDRISYGILFQLAWKRRYFNYLRVVWRYACTAGHVSWRMQERMMDSIITYAPQGGRLDKEDAELLGDGDEAKKTGMENGATEEVATTSRGRLWFAWAAKFAVGVRDGSPAPDPFAAAAETVIDTSSAQSTRAGMLSWSKPESNDLNRDASGLISPMHALSEQEQQLVTLASQQHLPSGTPESKSRLKLLKDILRRDTDEAGPLHPTTDFAELLELAWQKDTEKQKVLGLPAGLQEGQGFEEMLRQGLHVPMEVRNGN